MLLDSSLLGWGGVAAGAGAGAAGGGDANLTSLPTQPGQTNRIKLYIVNSN